MSDYAANGGATRRRGDAGAQLELGLDGKRRRRAGAGRPRKVAGGSPHERRPEVTRHTSAHVALRWRAAWDGCGLRRGIAVRRALAVLLGRDDFRVVHASIQNDHIHVIVEADDKRALANGLRAFMISAARHLNRARGRLGRVFPTRYHATLLRTPRQVRNAIA